MPPPPTFPDRRIRIQSIEPRPCGHEHHHFSEILACMEQNGNPGFKVVEHLF